MSKIKFHAVDKKHWTWHVVDIILYIIIIYLLYQNIQEVIELQRLQEYCKLIKTGLL